MTDVDLIRAYLEHGDEEAFAELWRRHEENVRRVCLRILRCFSDAEDATQDAALMVARRLSTYRGDCRFSSWLYRVAYNSALMFLRKKHSRMQFEEVSELELVQAESVENPERAMCARMDAARVRSIAKMIAPHYREPMLQTLCGYCSREMADANGTTILAIKSRVHRGREAFNRAANRSDWECFKVAI